MKKKGNGNDVAIVTAMVQQMKVIIDIIDIIILIFINIFVIINNFVIIIIDIEIFILVVITAPVTGSVGLGLTTNL